MTLVNLIIYMLLFYIYILVVVFGLFPPQSLVSFLFQKAATMCLYSQIGEDRTYFLRAACVSHYLSLLH